MSNETVVDEPVGHATPDAPDAQVQPMLAGKFAIYEDGKGGFYLFTDTGEGTQRKHIPAALVRMVTGGGFMGRKLSEIFGT